MPVRPVDHLLIGPSEKYLREMQQQMEIYDALTEEEAALAGEYGLARTLAALRQFYGRLAAARQHLEAERKALQIARWRNTT